MRFMSIVCNDLCQALGHAVRELSEEVWAESLSFSLDGCLQVSFIGRVVLIHRSLQHRPYILDRVEVRRPRRKVQNRHSVVVEPGLREAARVTRIVVLQEYHCPFGKNFLYVGLRLPSRMRP